MNTPTPEALERIAAVRCRQTTCHQKCEDCPYYATSKCGKTMPIFLSQARELYTAVMESLEAEGKVVVPREPTDEMLTMAIDIARLLPEKDKHGKSTGWKKTMDTEEVAAIYLAMLAAAKGAHHE